MAQNCPEKHDTLYTQEVVPYQSDFEHPEQLKTLVLELWNSSVLDSGATNTVAGKVWYNCYITGLNENEKQKIEPHTPGNTYRFEMENYFQHFKMLTYQSHWEAEILC